MENNKRIDPMLSEDRLKVIDEINEIYNYIRIKDFSVLIPEVRTNIAGALPNAKSKNEVAGIDGRITIVNGLPKAAGEVKFGVAEHTARLLLTAKEFDKTINFVVNLKYTSELIDKIKNNTDLELKQILREKEPSEMKRKEFSTMQWLIKESVNEIGRIPDIIWDKGSIGKEPMIRLFGKSSSDLIEKIRKIINIIRDE
ncbi:MAG: thiamine-phosphate synthase family protein [Promethearchaeota archaeon]